MTSQSNNGFTFISVSGTVVGKPEATNLPTGWKVRVSGGKARIGRDGMAVILR